MDTNGVQSITMRLDILINLMLQERADRTGRFPMRNQIAMLHRLGARPQEIATILGKTPSYVNKELSSLRKSKLLT